MTAALTPAAGDFGLVAIRGGAGRAIRIGQWLCGGGYANYEHAFLSLGAGLILEAEPGGARIRDLTEYDGQPVEWSTGRVDLTDAQRTTITAWAWAHAGVPYSALDYAAIACRRLRLWPLTVLLRRRVASSRHLICSQLVDAGYRAAGVELFGDRWPGYVIPADLHNLLATQPLRVPA